ncbi:MAG: TonB family protein, partial [Spirochaetes bacterium]|nr:TonB family protein [Spirochaetota bacterium]
KKKSAQQKQAAQPAPSAESKPTPPQQNKSKKTQKAIQPQEKSSSQPQQSQTPKTEKPEATQPLIESTDYIAEYEQQQSASQTQAEEEFFSEQQDEKSTGSASTPAVDSLTDIDNLLANVNDQANKNQGNHQDGKAIHQIDWSDGVSRQLLKSPQIILPDEISQAGLKFSVIIQFTVLENGLILTTRIIQSSANPHWDQVIMDQFKKWVFEPIADQKSIGVIQINIDY